MIILEFCRRMFPQCKINLSGLIPCSKYILLVDMVPVDGFRYKVTTFCMFTLEYISIAFHMSKIIEIRKNFHLEMTHPWLVSNNRDISNRCSPMVRRDPAPLQSLLITPLTLVINGHDLFLLLYPLLFASVGGATESITLF